MADDFEITFESDPRDIRYWQAKLDYARAQVRRLQTVPEAIPKYEPIGEPRARRGKADLQRGNYVFFKVYQPKVRKHKQERRHLRMWLTTKIPYYEARIEALRKPVWERLVGPDPW